MHRNNQTNASPNRHQHQSFPMTGSLIFTHQPYSPQNHTLQPKFKYDDFGFKKGLFQRHDSEKDFKKGQSGRPVTHFFPPQQPHEQLYSKHPIETIRNSQNYCKASHIKANQKPFPSSLIATSNAKVKNSLKETSSTTNTEGINTRKSERNFPSFLRSQLKSSNKLKAVGDSVSKSNFKVIRKLGQGKFGSVFLAQQIWTGMMVGLKVIEKAKIIKQNFVNQFIRELKIQSFLDHSNIIKVYGYFSDEENVYIILELGCDGQLFDVISRGKTLSQETTSFVIGNLLDAVGLMHQNKILHRDIKPQNIVLVHGNIKLCDFGWAVNKKEQLRNTFCGTPLYLSPELLKGSPYDEKVDLWAIGVLAFQLYFGCSPFDITQQQDLVKIITEQINYPSHKKASKEFIQFLQMILRKNPKQRMQSGRLVGMQFIKKYRQLQTCQQLCQ